MKLRRLWPVVLLFVFSSPVLAQPGSLDPTFGIGGVVTAKVNPLTDNYSHDVAVQMLPPVFEPKPVVAVFLAGDFCVLRYNANGSIDSTFGAGGVAKVAITAAVDTEEPHSLAIQSDGKIVVAGRAWLQSGRNAIQGFAVARLNSDGTVDGSFGSGGRVLFNFARDVSATAASVAVQPNGSIVVAGRSGNDTAVARLLPNGNFDPTFSGAGRAVLTLGKKNSPSEAKSVKLQADGKIVLGGNGNGFVDFAVVRLNPDGSFDQTFGGSGTVFTDFFARVDTLNQIGIDEAGNIVAAGRAFDLNSNSYLFAIARYLPNGQLDPTFNGTGKFVAGSPGYNELKGVAIDAVGRIIVAGRRSDSGGPGKFALLRLNPNGTLDAAFGTRGAVLTAVGSNDSAEAVALQPDGRIVVTGWANSLKLIVLARYLP